jgi:sugar phosphate isomerase/epimerase
VLDLHAKDLRDLKEKGSQCIVGQGAIPFPEIFRALDSIRLVDMSISNTKSTPAIRSRA